MIITLPITQRKTRPIPYFLTPLVGDILRKRTGNDLTISVNVLGARESNPEMSNGFSNDLRKIGIVYNLWSDLENFKSLFDNAKFTINKTRCIDKKENCYTCDCGLLEIPKSNVKFLKQKTFYLLGNEVFCRGCNNVSRLNMVDRFVMFFSNDNIESVQSNTNLSIYPDFYSSEFKDLLGQITQNGICINRQRNTGFTYGKYYLDVEFVWQNILALFAENNEITLVVNNHVLRQALIAILIFRELGYENKLNIVVSPYLSYLGNPEKWCIDRMIDLGHDTNTIRFMLASSLRWRKKNSVMCMDVSQVEYRRFNLLQNLVDNIGNKESDIKSTIEEINYHSMILGLKHVFNPSKFDYSKLCGLF